MKPPTYWKEIRQFIGVVNYYRDIWEIFSHALVPLSHLLPSKVEFKWTKTEQDTLDEIKRVVDCDNILTYPVFNEEFKIYTDASNFKLGAVIR